MEDVTEKTPLKIIFKKLIQKILFRKIIQEMGTFLSFPLTLDFLNFSS